jgi:hypothetical protein
VLSAGWSIILCDRPDDLGRRELKRSSSHEAPRASDSTPVLIDGIRGVVLGSNNPEECLALSRAVDRVHVASVASGSGAWSYGRGRLRVLGGGGRIRNK